jgi:hypothetical protein
VGTFDLVAELDGVEESSFILMPNEMYDLSLLCPRRSSEESISDRFTLTWRKEDRFGIITPLAFTDKDLSFLKASSVRFSFI